MQPAAWLQTWATLVVAGDDGVLRFSQTTYETLHST